MKKVLVLASLGLLALSFSCGSSGPGGETAANVETAAGMSSAVMQSGMGGFFGGIAEQSILKTDSTTIETIDCINTTATLGVIDVNLISDPESTTEVEMQLVYKTCGAPLCDGHVFMDGTLNENYTVSGETYSINIEGLINFVAKNADFGSEAPVYFAGKNCGIDIAANINYTTLMALIEEGDYDAIMAYLNTCISGTVCGWDWDEAVAALEDEDICTVIEA